MKTSYRVQSQCESGYWVTVIEDDFRQRVYTNLAEAMKKFHAVMFENPKATYRILLDERSIIARTC